MWYRVSYKEDGKTSYGSYDDWEEKGSYTVFKSDEGNTIIPTANVIAIEEIK